MTDEELKGMRERIAAAEAAARRVQNLTDAVRILEAKEPRQILLTLNDHASAPIRHRQYDDDRFVKICWSESETSLHQDLVEAVLNIMRARCDAAIAEYRAV